MYAQVYSGEKFKFDSTLVKYYCIVETVCKYQVFLEWLQNNQNIIRLPKTHNTQYAKYCISTSVSAYLANYALFLHLRFYFFWPAGGTGAFVYIILMNQKDGLIICGLHCIYLC